LRLALACLAFAGFASLPLAVRAQDMPEALRDKAFVVKVIAIIPANAAATGDGQAQSSSEGWQAESEKYTVLGAPVPFKLIGSNLVIIVQITPFEGDEGKGLTLIAQGQVWVRPPDGGLSYHTSVDKLAVDFGETVLFYPLGLGPEGRASMRLEISVMRASDLNQDGGEGDKAGK
jgi:hypothetical protein